MHSLSKLRINDNRIENNTKMQKYFDLLVRMDQSSIEEHCVGLQ